MSLSDLFAVKLPKGVFIDLISNANSAEFISDNNIGNIILEDKKSTQASFEFYPNPFTHDIHVVIPSFTQEGFLTIFNSTGQLVYRKLIKHSGESQNILISSDHFDHAGLYHVRFSNGSTQLIETIVRLK